MFKQRHLVIACSISLAVFLLLIVAISSPIPSANAKEFYNLPTAVSSTDSVTATRITNRAAPFIDGSLEEIWQRAGKITFPNADGSCFSPDGEGYSNADPSTFTIYYLHDDINLYIAIQTTDDTMVEGSDYDQNSDGLAGMALERKNDLPTKPSMLRLMWYTDTFSSTVYGPPIDRDRMVFDTEWRRSFDGTWNDNSDRDNGYTFEFSIPLDDPITGTLGLGGWAAGEQLRTNIVLIDHDSKPGASYDDPSANFRKCWWGNDSPENIVSTPRWIHLDNGPAFGPLGDYKTITATRIFSASAPIIDGNPNEAIWQQADQIKFPNSVGKSFTPSPSQAAYNTDDPSTYTLAFLHDDTYLYVSMKSDDQKIESAAYDQDSDGLISLVFDLFGEDKDQRYASYWDELDLWEEHMLLKPITDCDTTTVITTALLHFQEGPLRYPYDTAHVTWGPVITGTWNDNNNIDAGFAFEYRIPLTDVQGMVRTLGGYKARDLIPANIVITDHDDNPGGTYNDQQTHYRKYWWGFDGNEFYPPAENGEPGQRREIPPEQERYIFLDDSPPHSNSLPSLDSITKTVNYIANQQLLYSGLIRSFPDEMAAHLYDNAVALIVLTDAGRQMEAERLAKALISLLETDGKEGFFYDSYNVVDKRVGQGTASGTGPNTWAAFALAFYGQVYGDQAALDAAHKVAQWIINRLYDSSDGGVWGGVCHPFQEQIKNHSNDTIFNFKSTEQVIDTWHLFRILGYNTEAKKVASWLTTSGKGWIKQYRRFSTGTNAQCAQDERIYLDPQSWGSIVANMIFELDKADGAIGAAEDYLQVGTRVDNQPVLGFGDSYLPEDNVIWYGATAQMIVAYMYDGNLISATHFLKEMSKVQNFDGSWSHSSGDSHKKSGESCNEYESFHSSKPHIGETAWNYFALSNVKSCKRLPYLIPTRPMVNCSVYLPVIDK